MALAAQRRLPTKGCWYLEIFTGLSAASVFEFNASGNIVEHERTIAGLTVLAVVALGIEPDIEDEELPVNYKHLPPLVNVAGVQHILISAITRVVKMIFWVISLPISF